MLSHTLKNIHLRAPVSTVPPLRAFWQEGLCWKLFPQQRNNRLLAAAIAPLSPCQSSCTMDQKKSWWTLLRGSLVDPQLGMLQQSFCPTAVCRRYFKKRKGTRVSFDKFLLLRKATVTVFEQGFQHEFNTYVCTPGLCIHQVLFNMKQCNRRVITPTWTDARKPPQFVVCSGVTVTPSTLPTSHRAHTYLCVTYYLFYFNLSVNR